MSSEIEPRPTGGEPVPPRRRLPLSLVLLVAFVVVVTSIGGFIAIVPGCALTNMWRAGKGVLEDAGKLLTQTFHMRTEVRVGNTVQVYESSREVKEYVVLEEVMHREKSWNVTGWFYQQRGVDTEHRVRAKYGFDLQKGTIQLVENPVTGALTVRYPEPELLSVEVLAEDWQRREGWFNKVTDEEVKAAQEILRTSARRELSADETRLAKARAVFEERCRESLRQRGIEVDKFEAVTAPSQLEGEKRISVVVPPLD